MRKSSTPQCIVVDSEEREGESVLDFPNGTETITRVFQSGVPVISSKPERWWKGTIFQVALKREVQSEITAPLIYRDRTVGVMQVLSYKTERVRRPRSRPHHADCASGGRGNRKRATVRRAARASSDRLKRPPRSRDSRFAR